IVVAVPHDHGETVHEGDLIAQIVSRDLDKELKKLLADRDAATKQLSTLDTQISKAHSEDKLQLYGQKAEAEIKLKSANDQIAIIEEQLKSMSVAAPVSGIVTTWD